MGLYKRKNLNNGIETSVRPNPILVFPILGRTQNTQQIATQQILKKYSLYFVDLGWTLGRPPWVDPGSTLGQPMVRPGFLGEFEGAEPPQKDSGGGVGGAAAPPAEGWAITTKKK